MKHQHIYDLCKQHMHAYVLAETEDGNKFDGILTGLDEEYAYFAVPMDSGTGQSNAYTYPPGMMDPEYAAYHQQNMPKNYHQQGFNPTDYRALDEQSEADMRYGFPGYGWGFPGYGFGYPPRRFSRLVLPLAALVALSALPWY